MAQRWVAGEVSQSQWLSSQRTGGRRRIAAPTYPFAQERCWIVADTDTAPTDVVQPHPLITCNSSSLQAVSFDAWLPPPTIPDLTASLHGAPLVSAAAVLELACACASLAGGRRIRGIRDVVWTPTARAPGMQRVRAFVKEIGDDIEYVVAACGTTRDDDVHSEGRVLLGPRPPDNEVPLALSALKAKAAAVDGDSHYRALSLRGLEVGAGLRCVQALWLDGATALSRLALPASQAVLADQFVLHPAIIDGALQTALALLQGPLAATAYVPFALDELTIWRRPALACYAYAEAAPPRDDDDVRTFDVTLANASGQRLVTMRGLALKAVRHAASAVPLLKAR